MCIMRTSECGGSKGVTEDKLAAREADDFAHEALGGELTQGRRAHFVRVLLVYVSKESFDPGERIEKLRCESGKIGSKSKREASAAVTAPVATNSTVGGCLCPRCTDGTPSQCTGHAQAPGRGRGGVPQSHILYS